MFLKHKVLTGRYVEYFREKQNGTRGKAWDKKVSCHCRMAYIKYKQNRLTCQEVCDECFAGRGDVFVVRSRHFHLVHVVVNTM